MSAVRANRVGSEASPGETGRGGGEAAICDSKRAGGGPPWPPVGLRLLIGECGERARGAEIGARGEVLVWRYDDIALPQRYCYVLTVMFYNAFFFHFQALCPR